jgi:hypothetical protein
MIGRGPLGAFFILVVVACLAAPGGSAVTAPTMTSTPAIGDVRLARASVPAACLTPARRGFWPTRAKVQHTQKRVPVLAMGRYSNGIPKPPPLTSEGKRSFAWDKKGPAPGSHYGNVRFNAHTYPDGSALGNRLLAHLWVGGRVVVKGETKAICYKVVKRITVRPTSDTALVKYYNTSGPPKLAIVVCSGTRLGPGNWTRRTIWFAKPSTS